MLTPRTEHVAARPSWDCAVCEAPWPCANAKDDLLAQYRGFPTGLALFMASCLYEAIEGLTAGGTPVPVDLFEGFLSWVRPAVLPPWDSE
jgi:hypothetical protein